MNRASYYQAPTKPDIGISAYMYQLPAAYITISEMRARDELPTRRWNGNTLLSSKLKGITLDEVHGVHICETEEEGSLARTACRQALQRRGIGGGNIGLLLDYSTVSRASNGLSLCYKIQREIQAINALTLAIGNGSCASLQLALQTAIAFMQTREEISFALLFAEDRVRGRRFQPPVNALGDGASALLLERNLATLAVVDTAYASIGKFCNILGIRHEDEDNFDVGEFENSIVPLHYKVIRDLVWRILERHRLSIDEIDLILYQNMSLNDYQGLAGALDVKVDRIYTDGLKGHGHVFGSDLVINLFMAGNAGKLQPGNTLLLISSGAGFSWGVALLRC